MSNEMDQNDTDERERLLRRIRYGPVSIEDQTSTERALREAIAVAGSKSELARRSEMYPPLDGIWLDTRRAGVVSGARHRHRSPPFRAAHLPTRG
jgi:hypothetical protein